MAGLNRDPAPAKEAPGLRPPNVREQIAVLAHLRWLIFKNSMRTLQGRLELVSTIFTGLGLTVGWLGMGVALGVGAYLLVSHAHTQWLPALFWVVFVFWQFFPIVTTAFAAAFDSTNLLRFPIAYSVVLFARPRLRLRRPSQPGRYFLAPVHRGGLLGRPSCFSLGLRCRW